MDPIMEKLVVAVIFGVLMAIVYSLKVLFQMERRICRIDVNIDKIARRILEEELKIQEEEKKIAKMMRKVLKKKK